MSFKSKETLLEEINVAFQALNNGKFDLEKMNLLIENTRELYERAVILRFKAQEVLVKENHVSFQKDVEEVNTNPDVKTAEIISEKEIVQPVDQVTEAIQEQTVERSGFSVNDKGSDFVFDLFGANSTPEEESANIDIENNSNLEGNRQEESNKIAQDIVSTNKEKESIKFTENQLSDTLHPLFSRYESVTLNPKSQMVASKINLMAEAFSLNEKLFYIRELFEGSSNEFNQAIETIDQLTDFQEAKIALTPLAAKYNWDLNQAATVDFINKVERRFL